MNESTSNVRIRYLDLDASNVDAEAVGALVGVVREFQGGRSLESVAAVLTDKPEAAVERSAPPRALPALKKARKPRAPKSAEPGTQPAKGKRAGNAGGTILAALRKSPRPDLVKLATAIYGDGAKTAKVKQVLGYMAGAGKITNNGDGTYTVNG